MSFTPGIPASGQTLGNSRLQVLNNFASLRETISQGSGNPVGADQPNHVDVNNGSGLGAGKHIFVQMPSQAAGAINLPGAQEGGLIATNISSGTELFYARDGNATRYQMTGPLFTGQGALTTGGTTMLFGGIILKWGQIAAVAGVQNITFATETGSAFPNACFSAVVARSVAPVSLVNSFTNTTLTIVNQNVGGIIFFMAIGN